MELTGTLGEEIRAKGYATTNEMAELCGRDPSRIRHWLIAGRIRGERIRLPKTRITEWKIPVDEILRFDLDAVSDYHYSRKLTPTQVHEIRALRGKMPQTEIAERYGISAAMVSRILSGKRRADV